jgi:hypothetical protein
VPLQVVFQNGARKFCKSDVMNIISNNDPELGLMNLPPFLPPLAASSARRRHWIMTVKEGGANNNLKHFADKWTRGGQDFGVWRLTC